MEFSMVRDVCCLDIDIPYWAYPETRNDNIFGQDYRQYMEHHRFIVRNHCIDNSGKLVIY